MSRTVIRNAGGSPFAPKLLVKRTVDKVRSLETLTTNRGGQNALRPSPTLGNEAKGCGLGNSAKSILHRQHKQRRAELRKAECRHQVPPRKGQEFGASLGNGFN